jgi:adenine-specific DNA-methyltransferase
VVRLKHKQGQSKKPLKAGSGKTEFSSVNVSILHGDALSELKRIPSNSVQLVVTSPPYNIGKEYEVRREYSDYLKDMKPIIFELVRILRPGGSICWQVGNGVRKGEVIPLDVLYYPIFKAQGMALRNRIVWSFGHGLHAQRRFSGRHETILWFTKGNEYTFNLDAVRVPAKYPKKRHYKGPKKGKLSGNPLGKNPGDVWEITNIKALHPEKTNHPCQFPVALVDRLVRSLSNPGDIVVDPFLGSGTTVLAAAINGRKSVGIEISEKYIKIAKFRIKEFIQGKSRFVIPLDQGRSKKPHNVEKDTDARRAN